MHGVWSQETWAPEPSGVRTWLCDLEHALSLGGSPSGQTRRDCHPAVTLLLLLLQQKRWLQVVLGVFLVNLSLLCSVLWGGGAGGGAGRGVTCMACIDGPVPCGAQVD